MDIFTVHSGVAAPLMKANIDTDAIIPSREMKRVSKVGLADGLFAGWRYMEQGGREPNPEFVLNLPKYEDTSILLAGANFGCGSSREHAVWALKEYGIRAIVAASFGTIFMNNCVRNGILPVVLDEADIQALADHSSEDPQHHPITIDLQAQQLHAADGRTFAFQIPANDREMLLEGLDPIALTLKRQQEIDGFQQRDKTLRPWIYLRRES
jgi:3-isopropylmalate/(R)-2-methylmalate dehydratase small subunit